MRGSLHAFAPEKSGIHRSLVEGFMEWYGAAGVSSALYTYLMSSTAALCIDVGVVHPDAWTRGDLSCLRRWGRHGEAERGMVAIPGVFLL